MINKVITTVNSLRHRGKLKKSTGLHLRSQFLQCAIANFCRQDKIREKEGEKGGEESALTFKSKRAVPSSIESHKELRKIEITWYRKNMINTKKKGNKTTTTTKAIHSHAHKEC